jgi:hypothetical protein
MDCVMQNAQNDEIWRAAQHRRTEDLSRWVSRSLERTEKMPAADHARVRPNLGLALVRNMAIVAITLAAITSVSAVVHANKSTHVALKATGPMPAVSVP